MKKKIYLVAGIICAVLAIILAIKAIPRPKEEPVIIEPTPSQSQETEASSGSAEANTEKEPEPEPEPEPGPEPEPYVSPVDFAGLKEINPDIYAWFAIPGTDISYPVLQNPNDDEYYLRRDFQRNYAADGSLFTQARYNSLEFDDPVTIIYGHRTNNGSMFGQLQDLYLGSADFSDVNEFVIFLPDKELHYRIFCGVPHSNEHILYYHNFHNKEAYQKFLDDIYGTTDVAADFDREAFATTEDTLVILETCLKTNRTRRFLVIGKLIETID